MSHMGVGQPSQLGPIFTGLVQASKEVTPMAHFFVTTASFRRLLDAQATSVGDTDS